MSITAKGSNARTAHWLFNALLLLGLLFLYALALEWAPINKDSGYFLSVAEDMARGEVAFRDIHLRYPPLGFGIFSLVAQIFGSPPYQYYLLLAFFVQIACGALIYRIAGLFKKDTAAQATVALLTLFAFYVNDGFYVVLEYFVVLWSLLALYMVLAFYSNEGSIGKEFRTWVYAGGFAVLAALSKQYGGAAFLCLLAGAVWLPRGWAAKARSLVGLGLGAALVGIVFFEKYYFSYGISPAEVLGQLLKAGEDYGVRNVMWTLKYLFWHFAAYLPFLVFWVTISRKYLLRDRRLHLTMAMMCLFMLPLYFKLYPHYTLLFMAYGYLVGYWVYASQTGERALKIMAVVAMGMGGWLAVLSARHIAQVHQTHEKETMQAYAAELKPQVPAGAKVLLYGGQHFYYMNDFQPVDKKKYGYRFYPPVDTDSTLLRNADFVLNDTTRKEQIPTELLMANGFRKEPFSAEKEKGWQWWRK